MDKKLHQTIQRCVHLLIICTFLFGIVTPLVLAFYENDQNFSEAEKRYLTQIPKNPTSVSEVVDWTTAFSQYFSDQFGLRPKLVSFYKDLQLFLGDSPSRFVVLGKDGWLFLGSLRGEDPHGDPIGDYRNVNLFSEKHLLKFVQHVTGISYWLQLHGIRYYFVVVPNKHTVYSEFLPGYISKQSDMSALDQWAAKAETYPSLEFVDLRESLRESKSDQILYKKTDTHWNHYGAGVAQKVLIDRIAKDFPGKLNHNAVRYKTEVRKGGDLANFIGIATFTEIEPYPVFEDASCDIADFPYLTTPGPPHSLLCDRNELDLLVFGDSFFSALQPYTAMAFKNSVYNWSKVEFETLNDQLLKFSPDVVIEEVVERALPIITEDTEFVKIGKYHQGSQVAIDASWNIAFGPPNLRLTDITEAGFTVQAESGLEPFVLSLSMVDTYSEYILYFEVTGGGRYSSVSLGKADCTTKVVSRQIVSSTKEKQHVFLQSADPGVSICVEPQENANIIVFTNIELREYVDHSG